MNVSRELLVVRYDSWLDLYGVPGKDRKALRNELKANLMEAEAAQGWPAARAGVGSVQDLAREHAEAVRDPHRPAWGVGVTVAALVFGAVMWSMVWTMFAFADGVFAGGIEAGRTIEAPVTLLPGSRFSAGRDADGAIWTSAYFSPWLVLGLPFIGFLLGSRVWRLLGSR